MGHVRTASHWTAIAGFLLANSAAYAADPAPPAIQAPQQVDAPADVALLEAVVRAKAKDKGAAEEVAKTLTRIAQIQESKGDAKAAAATRERQVEWFDQLGLARDGSVPAALTAEARLKNLEPAVQRELAKKLVDQGKATAEARKSLESWHEAVVGAWKVAGKEVRPAKGVALVEQLAKVRDYKAPMPARAAALRQGRLVIGLYTEVAALAALESGESQAQLTEQSKVYRDLAASLLETAWKESDTAAQRDSVALEIRKELTRIKPAEYPPLEAQGEEQLTPQQQEASKLAALAQRAAKPVLKVMYLKKALALDPNNAQLKELLRAAEAEQAKEQ